MSIKKLKSSFVLPSLLIGLLTACSTVLLAPASEASYRLTILDQTVVARSTINGIMVSELSGLAWDEDEQLLYAISDRGYLFHFYIDLTNEQINEARPFAVYPLVDEKGNKIKRVDPEGLWAVNANNNRRGDTELVVAMEYNPRLLRINTAGKTLGEEPIHSDLKDRHAYRGGNLSGNTMLESVVYHPDYGFITAPELPLKKQPQDVHTLYAASPSQTWSFPAYPAPNSAITALDLLPNGDLLVLERAWSGFPNPLVISLRQLDIANCEASQRCEVKNLKVFSSLLSIDNFEGLTHIRDNLYLMVSDDGQHDLLRTRLVLFKVE